MNKWLDKYDDTIVAQGGESIPLSREERGLNQRLYNTIQPGIYPENFSQWAYNIRNVINNNNRFDSTRQVKKYDKLSDKLLKADESNDYDQVQNILNEMDHIKEFQSEDDPYSEDGWLKYLGLPQKNNTFTTSDQKPSRSENPNTTYYKLPNEFEKELLELYQKKLIKLPEDSIVNEKVFENVFGENKSRARVLQHFKFGEDQDDKGKYISYYDKYDLNPEVPIIGKINIPIGDPYEIYNRIYLDEPPKKEQGGTIPKAQEGTTINPKTGEKFYLTNEKGRFTPFDKRAYKTILPAEYPNEPGALKRAALSFITGKPLLGGAYDEKAISRFSKSKDYGAEMWKYALGSNDPMISVEASKYKPSDSEDPDARYFAIKDIDKQLYANHIINELGSKNKKRVHINDVPIPSEHVSHGVANYTIGKEEDEQGKYVSYYDIYDFDNPIVNSILDRKPETYDRIYYEENPFYKEYQNIEATRDSLFNTGTEENRKKATDLISNRTKIIKRANEAGYSVFDPIQVKDLQKGGNMSYTPEYIEQLKQFENRPDNLAYHLDNKKIPTIGWGHRITEEELKRKAIKMGKEWIPYEKFSGKEGRQYADRLMELDVAHHYNRLERQVGKDTLATLPSEVQDVLLDITYNRGSLGDSLEYVKSGDIAGLREYLAETSKGLKGGAKTRMEWRANRIPVKTLPPVEVPINYNIGNQYVPKVLQDITQTPVQDNEGYRNQENYGKPVQIVSNQSTTPISMQGVPFPILAMSDTGELKVMFPGEEHEFEGGSVTELPIAQEGINIPNTQNGMIYERDDSGLKRKLNYLQGRWQDSPYPEILSNLYDNTLGIADYDKPYVGGVAPLPASKIKFDPKSFGVNRIFEPFTLIKSTHPNRFITKPSYNYRLTGQGQIDDMIEQGYVVAKRGKISGGRSNETHWSKGGADYSPQEGKYLLESNKVVHEQVGGIPLSDVNIYKSVGQKWEPYKLGSSTHEKGGNIKKSKQLRTFTEDNGWLNKYKEL